MNSFSSVTHKLSWMTEYLAILSPTRTFHQELVWWWGRAHPARANSLLVHRAAIVGGALAVQVFDERKTLSLPFRDVMVYASLE